MSPDTLRKLREWLTLEEAASELSTALSEDVDASDVLRLVLDGQLQLSIHLPAKTTARCRKLDDDAPDAPWTPGTIEGVWDVPMVDRAKSQIEHDYQMGACHRTMCTQRGPSRRFGRAGRPSSAKSPPTWGVIFCRDLRLSSHKGASLLFAGRRLRSSFGNMHPSQRRPADPLDKPLGQRERTTLLTIIAALAKEAKVDVSKPVKSGQIISALIAAIGYEVAPNTVAGHLRTLRKTLFGETRKTPEGQ